MFDIVVRESVLVKPYDALLEKQYQLLSKLTFRMQWGQYRCMLVLKVDVKLQYMLCMICSVCHIVMQSFK